MDITPIENSSNLTGYAYSVETKEFGVEFKGGAIYIYYGVPKELVDEFAASLSKGGFLSMKIKGKFECRKLEVVTCTKKIEINEK